MVTVAAALLLAGCGGDSDEPAGPGPFEVALDHVGERDADAIDQDTVVEDDEATVTLTFEGLRDDSVRAERHVITLVPDGESWRVVEDEVTYRCHEGRGQQQFSAELCR